MSGPGCLLGLYCSVLAVIGTSVAIRKNKMVSKVCAHGEKKENQIFTFGRAVLHFYPQWEREKKILSFIFFLHRNYLINHSTLRGTSSV